MILSSHFVQMSDFFHFLLQLGRALVDPLQRIHVSIQDLTYLADWIIGILGAGTRVDVLDDFLQVFGHLPQLSINVFGHLKCLFPLQVGMLVNGQIGQGLYAFLQRYEQLFQLSLLRLDEIHFRVQVFLIQLDSFQSVVQLRYLVAVRNEHSIPCVHLSGLREEHPLLLFEFARPLVDVLFQFSEVDGRTSRGRRSGEA